MPPAFSIRANSVDVEQIMKQIRTRIREKRGVDYTEAEIRELASIKLETFLDPSRVRSELLDHYRRGGPTPPVAPLVVPPPPANYEFEADTAYLSSRGALGRTLYAVRRLLNPLLKLFINPNPMIHVLNMQSTINRETWARFDGVLGRFHDEYRDRERHRVELDALGYEVAHNLVVEMTRLGIEVKNLKMRVESLAGRLDFSERRARALESIVQYRPGSGPGQEPPARPKPAGEERRREDRHRDEGGRDERAANGGGAGIPKGEAQRSRRKRRRRGRGAGAVPQGSEITPGQQNQAPPDHASLPSEGGGHPARPDLPARSEGPDSSRPEDQ
ncbi:MAG: hypothetical protein AB1806_16430 [Acidobacteriota bacterium]